MTARIPTVDFPFPAHDERSYRQASEEIDVVNRIPERLRTPVEEDALREADALGAFGHQPQEDWFG